jgi:hypothetical protein
MDQTSEAPRTPRQRPNKNAWLRGAGSLKIQSGINEPLSWGHWSHAGRAMVERMLVTTGGIQSSGNVNKKTRRKIPPGANREFQFPE